MNHSFLLSKVSGAALAAVVAGCLSTSVAHAQTDFYFDPGMNANNAAPSGSYTGTGSGGSGVWDTEMTADWVEDESGTSGTGAGFDTVFPAPTDADGPGIANFDNAGGNVDVATPVSPFQININVTDGVTENIGVTQDSMGNPVSDEANQITLGPVGNTAPAGEPSTTLNPINIGTGTENVNFNSNLNLNIENQYYNSGVVNDATTGNVAIEGGITFTNNTTPATDPITANTAPTGNSLGEPNLTLNATAGGTFTIDSTVTLANVSGSEPIQNGNNPNLVIQGASGATAVAILTTNAVFDNVDLIAGANSIVYDKGATYDLGTFTGNGNGQVYVTGGGEYLADTAGMTVQSTVEVEGSAGIVGSDLAAVTNFSGNSNPVAPGTSISAYNGGTPYLTSAAGGRVNFLGDVFNSGGSIYKIGAGIVSMDDAGTVRAEDQQGGFEIQNGTLLASTTNAITGSGVMIDNVPTSSLVAGTQTYATLGGVGSVSALVTAAGANSSITPGDPAVNNGIGTLTLSSGLTASSGAIFNFTLDGARSNGFSAVAFDASDLTLGGTVTFNFTNLGGALDTGVDYNVLTNFAAIGSGSSDEVIYDLMAPAGYIAIVDPADLLPGATNLGVEFEQTSSAVPEPSTWALVGLGALVLIGSGKLRKLSA